MRQQSAWPGGPAETMARCEEMGTGSEVCRRACPHFFAEGGLAHALPRVHLAVQWLCAGLVAFATLAGWAAAGEPSRPAFALRWMYASQNLLVDKNVDELIALIERAGKAGYNGMLLADYKFNILDRMPERYFKNVERVKAAAARAGIEIVPAVFPIGYSDGLLAQDPNLAEGFPVIDAPYEVKNGAAVLAAEPPALANGGLEETKGERFAGFGFQDDPGRATVIDRDVKHSGAVSCRIANAPGASSSGNARLIQKVSVRPHTGYRLSCWVKTRDLEGAGFGLKVIGAGKGSRSLTFYEGGLPATQDWSLAEVVFNSLDQSEVNLYVGLWGPAKGTLWVDDLALDELDLVNVLRRPGCPFTVTSADGKTRFQEKRDFLPVADPKLGQVPYAGQYDFHHEGAAIKLAPRSSIKEGSRLRVSWYHPVLVHREQMMCCLSEPRVYQILADQAMRVNVLFRPKTFFMSHDEIRVANWCAACRARKMTPGAMLADNTRRCVKILHDLNPQARVAVWSDMFDPSHNAVDNYYLVNGTLAGSWEGLPKDVLIANWNSGKAAKSLRFFADRGHAQLIAGYYDDGMESFKHWQSAAQGIPRVEGFMYTTWQHKYRDLEAYGKAMSGSAQ